MKNKIIILTLTLSVGLISYAQTAPQLGKDPVKKVVAAMTLEEKATLVVGGGMRMPGAPRETARALEQMSPVVGQTQDLVPGAAGTTYAIPRLGIPHAVMLMKLTVLPWLRDYRM
jgi:beta-glucosidase